MHPFFGEIFDGGNAHMLFKLCGKIGQGKTRFSRDLRDVFLYEVDIVELGQ